MAPKKRKADTNKLKQASSYKNKLRPRKEPANLATQLSSTISRKKLMPSEKHQSAVKQRSSATKTCQTTSKKKKRNAPPASNKKSVPLKKCKIVATTKTLKGRKKYISTSPSQKLSYKERKKSTFKAPYPQQYSFPENIIFYAARNPLFPAGHLKLMKSCKALFRMSRIVPVKNLEKTSHISYDMRFIKHIYDEDKWKANDGEEIIKHKKKFFKLWIYDKLDIDEEVNPNFASILVKRIHLCTLRDLIIRSQHLTFNELQILVGGEKLEEIDLYETIIKNCDGSITEFGKVFDALCCRNMIIYLPDEQNGVTKVTSKKIVEVLESDKAVLDVCVRLMNVPEAFDFEAITGFLKANMDQEKHTIDLEFADNLSDSYKNGLQKYVNEIIKFRGIYAHTLPIICFDEQDRTAWGELRRMRYSDVDGIHKKPGTDRVRRKPTMSARRSVPF